MTAHEAESHDGPQEVEDRMPIVHERITNTKCRQFIAALEACTERVEAGGAIDSHGHPETCTQELFDKMDCVNHHVTSSLILLSEPLLLFVVQSSSALSLCLKRF